MAKKKDAAVYPPTPPKRHERREEWSWPPPTPLPRFPPEDARRILMQILERLDAIEKRLEGIERALMKDQRTR